MSNKNNFLLRVYKQKKNKKVFLWKTIGRSKTYQVGSGNLQLISRQKICKENTLPTSKSFLEQSFIQVSELTVKPHFKNAK